MNFTCTAKSPPERFAMILMRHGRFDEPSFLAAHGQAGADPFAYAYAAAIAREAATLLADHSAARATANEEGCADFLGAHKPVIQRFATGLSHLRLDTASLAVDLLRARLCQQLPQWADGSKLARDAARALCAVFEDEDALPPGHKALCNFLLHSGSQDFVARAVARRSAVSSEQQAAARGALAAVAAF